MSDEAQIEVQVAAGAAGVPDTEFLVRWVQAALTADSGTVSVRVVDPAEMQALNREFRDADRPTNVLSFPAGRIEGLPPEETGPLGDIVICADVVRAEAEEQGKAHDDHWAHMLVHGALHLLGYDHVTDTQAADMEQLEIRILERGGVRNPYLSR